MKNHMQIPMAAVTANDCAVGALLTDGHSATILFVYVLIWNFAGLFIQAEHGCTNSRAALPIWQHDNVEAELPHVLRSSAYEYNLPYNGHYRE